MLKDSVAVGIHRQGNTTAPDDSLNQQEVAVGILMFTKQGERDRSGSIIHSQEQGEPWSSSFQPVVIAAIHLHQHTLLQHTFPPQAMARWPAMAWAGKSSAH